MNLAQEQAAPKRGLNLPGWKVEHALAAGLMQHRVRPWMVQSGRMRVGDRLWVREDYAVAHEFDGRRPSKITQGSTVRYAGTSPSSLDGLVQRCARNMPAWASRVHLQVVSIEFERLNEVDHHGLLMEGVRSLGNGMWGCSGRSHDQPLSAFIEYWNQSNPTLAWEINPLVPVVTLSTARVLDLSRPALEAA